jgi:ribosome recycling factor
VLGRLLACARMQAWGLRQRLCWAGARWGPLACGATKSRAPAPARAIAARRVSSSCCQHWWLAERERRAVPGADAALGGVRGLAKKAGGASKGKRGGADADADDDAGPSTSGGASVDLDKSRGKLSKLLEALRGELGKLRARPDASMLDHVRVDAYGKSNALSAVAQVTLKSPKLLQVSVFDPQMLEPVRAAVEQSGLGLNPSLEGGSLMVPVPKASKETRDLNAKKCKELREKTRTNVNNVRRDTMKEVSDLKKSKAASEDECFRMGKEVDAIMDKAQAEVVKLCEEREKEILSG